MLKIAICDDCAEHQTVVKEFLKTSNKLTVPYEIESFFHGIELLNSPHLGEFHLIFLDIVMEEMDGITTLSRLKNLNCYIIFMSSTSDRMRELFQKNVLGFLDKPLQKPDFEVKLEEFIALHEKEQKKYFTVEKQGIPQQIPEADILYFENLGHYIYLYTTHEVIEYKAKIGDLWRKLEENPVFAMPNRSFIIHLKYTALSSKNTLDVGNCNKMTTISIGRTRKEDTLSRFISYVSGRGTRGD
ncbi:MAG: LytTR family DNA-binding domain-containing protein [Eubacteriales bacterium]